MTKEEALEKLLPYSNGSVSISARYEKDHWKDSPEHKVVAYVHTDLLENTCFNGEGNSVKEAVDNAIADAIKGGA